MVSAHIHVDACDARDECLAQTVSLFFCFGFAQNGAETTKPILDRQDLTGWEVVSHYRFQLALEGVVREAPLMGGGVDFEGSDLL